MRFVFVVVGVVLALLPTGNALAEDEVTPDIYPLVFPIDGEHHFTDTWGAPRSGNRAHEGTDILADKMVPVVAVADGTVGWMHDSVGGKCCAMALEHDDGWSSWYIHLNNDTPGTDDGLGWGFADGISTGVHVGAGQLIGYVGDSGNAEWTAPHVHFELHQPDGTKVNPYPHLIEAISSAALAELGEDPVCPPNASCDTVALVDAGPEYHLMSSLRWPATLDTFFYGNPSDFALMGDWDCDGTSTPAMYRSSNGFMYLRNSNTQGVADIEFFYGDPSDVPLAGDFNGDGCDTLAIYRPDEGKVYIRNSLGTGVADHEFFFGNPGDRPFVGDFNGDGIDTVGLHRAETGFVYFRNENSSGVADFEFFYGDPGDVLIAGDWDGNGDDSVAVFRPSTGMLYIKYSNGDGVADLVVPVGEGWETALVASKQATDVPDEEGTGGEEDEAPEEESTAWPADVEQWRATVEAHFSTERVEAALSVISCESNGDPNALNPTSGAAGLFQFMPTTWDWVAGELAIEDYDSGAPFDPDLNTEAAGWLVEHSIDGGDDAWSHWSCQP